MVAGVVSFLLKGRNLGVDTTPAVDRVTWFTKDAGRLVGDGECDYEFDWIVLICLSILTFG
jgi:hypothetical protein